MATGEEDPAERLRRRERELADARAAAAPGDPAAPVLRARLERARALRGLGRRDDALADVAEVIDRIGADPDDLRLRETLAWALGLRLRWARMEDADQLAAARELFSVCNDQPSDQLERLAAFALGLQADTQRRLGEVRAAIATRRWLVSEFGEVRAWGRPALVEDQLHWLGWDLLGDGQPGEAAQTAVELIARLEATEVPDRESRIAAAMELRVEALRRAGEVSRARAVCVELQSRFAHAEEPGARRAALWSLARRAERELYDEFVMVEIDVVGELLRRFAAETDPEAIVRMGASLERVVNSLATDADVGAMSLVWRVAVLARIGERFPRLLGRRRLRRPAIAVAHLDAAQLVNDALEERFRDDTSPHGRALYGRAVINRARIKMRTGHPRQCRATVLGFIELGGPVLTAVVQSATPVATGRYLAVDWIVALLGTSIPLGPGADADRTRSAIRDILESRTPAARAATTYLLRGMERAAR